MKLKTTKKEIEKNYGKIIKVGYCRLQSLLNYKNPIAYTCGREGWHADIYDINGIAIVMGYKPFGNITPDYDTCRKYEVKAEKYLYSGLASSVEMLLDEFIQEVTKNEPLKEKKKYELTSETKMVGGRKVYRIKALTSFGDVKAGDLGGFVEKEENLSQTGKAWVFGEAVVTGNAVVEDDAVVRNYAEVTGNAMIKGHAVVTGKAWVKDNAWVGDDALVEGNAVVKGNAWVKGNAKVRNYAVVKDNVLIKDNAVVQEFGRVEGDAVVADNALVAGHPLKKEYEASSLNLNDLKSAAKKEYSRKDSHISNKEKEMER
ncbi:hypothetical protein [Bulleidia sp. zg-1006]|uniref:hypothetical protein n=1 Tax=Bulleidia sp. zg-1006 TaxID=2806552 RepID=UPI00193A2A5B|nr:hypothetical protein [Bulleidia sp. zg-1006]QRG86054.1 hypothetical protein JOS54_04055 [Bulleidia sp. zg-1006]